jgi:cellulose synthase/poly-beta-1,6-N-acetylglucosamine synthase-like glycosyltransferase
LGNNVNGKNFLRRLKTSVFIKKYLCRTCLLFCICSLFLHFILPYFATFCHILPYLLEINNNIVLTCVFVILKWVKLPRRHNSRSNFHQHVTYFTTERIEATYLLFTKSIWLNLQIVVAAIQSDHLCRSIVGRCVTKWKTQNATLSEKF